MRRELVLAAALAAFTAQPAFSQESNTEEQSRDVTAAPPKGARPPALEAAEAAAEAVVDAAARPRVPAPAPPFSPASDSDEVRPRSLARPASVLNYEALGPNPADYPAEAWVAGDEGEVGYSLIVGADGKPEGCSVTSSSGSSTLDAATCRLAMERIEFDPARDDDGNAVRGRYSSQYRWTRREPEFGGPMTIHVAYTVGADGVTRNCDVIEISGTISEQMQRTFDREPCPGSRNSAGGAPFRDENGIPVERRVNLRVIVEVEETAE